MVAQNLLSNPNQPVFSSGSRPKEEKTNAHAAASESPFGALVPPKAEKKKLVIKKPVIITLACLLVIGAGVGVYFAFFNNHATEEGEPNPLANLRTTYVSDGSTSASDINKSIDEKISSSKDDEEKFANTLAKANFNIAIEDYEAALDVLNSVDDSNLSDYEQYALYNSYATVYTGLGDASSAASYKALADAAHERDIASFQPTEE